ncbi:ABC transporter B family protein [Planoprotostelium fungivorum]|uniref:Mitochondrial potassium channel ATP-binding subunit n=1 Tax=Planoprotostelium fungivorum TaxID=1890364 RepID=A0A2P6NPZ3_9EUKA|nr:ABC transporter B family protein [Planoprotostelium fungivorum]
MQRLLRCSHISLSPLRCLKIPRQYSSHITVNSVRPSYTWSLQARAVLNNPTFFKRSYTPSDRHWNYNEGVLRFLLELTDKEENESPQKRKGANTYPRYIWPSGLTNDVSEIEQEPGKDPDEDSPTRRAELERKLLEEEEKRHKLTIKLMLALPALGAAALYCIQELVFKYLEEENEIDEESLIDKEELDLPPPTHPDDLRVAQTRSIYSDLIQLLRPELHWFIAALISSFASSAISLYIPAFLGRFIDAVREGSKSNVSFSQGLTVAAAVIIGQAILNFLFNFSVSRICDNVSTRLRLGYFAALMNKDITFYDKNSTGELVSGMISDVTELKNAIKHTLAVGLKSTTAIVGGLASLFVISARLTTMIMIIMPSLVFIGTIYGRFLQNLSKNAQRALNKSTAVAEESLSNIRTVRSFTGEEIEQARYGEALRKYSDINNRLGLSVGLFHGFYNVCVSGGFGFILLYGGNLVSAGQMTGGALTSYLVQSSTLQSSMVSLSVLQSELVKGLSAAARIFDAMSQQPRIPIAGGRKTDVVGRIAFNNVTFRYPTRPNVWVLRKFSLNMEEGKKYALVGPSGSGKSTVAWLLERFYDPEAGSIMIDGFNLKTLDPQYLRNQISLVSQEPALFATSISENIRMGNPNSSMSDIVRAAKLANADGFIRNFPAGYDTVVGERGLQLSGGQKQRPSRIAIARAILKNAPILILDEATSALDTESEQLVQDALETLMKEKTVIMIAHRLSSIQRADQILVIKGGKVIETGTHKELMAKKAAYANLVSKQMFT